MNTQHSRRRRGESTIIANLILFIAVMGMAAATVAIFKNMLDEGTSAASSEKSRSVNVMQTDFVVASATYNAGVITAYVKNTGQANFDPSEVDVYLDGIRISRDNRTAIVAADTDTVNAGTWDPGEELELDVPYTYAVPASHTFAVYTPNGVKADAVFSS